jgi:glycosyltransferase involved in cell wall biosynthesis
MGEDQIDLICVSHLWWDWVWQRPQQLLSRLARDWRVLWVDEPRLQIGPPGDHFAIIDVAPNIRVARLVGGGDPPTFRRRLNEALEHTSARAFHVSENITKAGLGFTSSLQERLEREVSVAVASWRRNPLVLWLYTPAALPFLDLLRPDLVVYDVMDELSAFKFAPPAVVEQERVLLTRADLVFAGGPSLYEARQGRHPDLHLFPSGVEQAHFARALAPDLPIPCALRDLPRPVLGFFGVIDERLDRDLLAQAAAARPEWSWVLVGPVLKIEERDLPQAPNIHYLGQQEYADLPAFLKAFDVALLPFARNEATRFLSPTKTLEYMAAHKPIVATALPDVVRLYGDVVWIADGADTFVAAIEGALAEGPEAREARNHRERALLARYDWDQIAGEMRALITDRLARKLASRGEG